jgi:putative hydrolase of the HAD superfamily
MRLHGTAVLESRNSFYRENPGWQSPVPGRKLNNEKNIEVIYFDKGGTLSHRVKLDDNGRSQIQEIMDRVGARGPVDEFGKMLDSRNKIYKQWSVDHWAEPEEEIIWTRFMLPDYPEEIVRYHAQKLVLLYSHSKGLRQFKPEARDVIRELSSRGYRLGAITNTVSRVLVPGELDDAGIADYMETLVMSSVTGIRKPDPRLFLLATRIMDIDPSRCAYVGDQVDRDAEGPKRSGFGLSVIVSGKKAPFVLDELEPIQKPDIVIDKLEDLLDLFR